MTSICGYCHMQGIMWFQMCQSVLCCNEDCVKSQLPDLVVWWPCVSPFFVVSRLDTVLSWPCVDKDMPVIRCGVTQVHRTSR